MKEISFDPPQELVDYYAAGGRNMLVPALDPKISEATFAAVSSLKTRFPELNSKEHANSLWKSLALPEKYGEPPTPEGRARLVVASIISFDAI